MYWNFFSSISREVNKKINLFTLEKELKLLKQARADLDFEFKKLSFWHQANEKQLHLLQTDDICGQVEGVYPSRDDFNARVEATKSAIVESKAALAELDFDQKDREFLQAISEKENEIAVLKNYSASSLPASGESQGIVLRTPGQ